MNRPDRQLLVDMLGDSASPEFRAALMDKTLRSARQRKRVRRLNLVLGVTALAGVFVLTILELRAPTSVRNPLPQSDSLVANSQKLSSVPMVSTRQAAVENTQLGRFISRFNHRPDNRRLHGQGKLTTNNCWHC